MDVNNSFDFESSTSSGFVNTTHLPNNLKYVSIINGYVVPCLAIIVLITNAVVVLVFRRQKTYGPSQAGLVGVAVSDTLTMLFPAPFYFYEYGLDTAIPCDLLEVKDGISIYLPTITHTASIWLTVTLAAQRFLYVCKPFVARKWCTLKNTTIIIIVTYILAVFMHLSRFFVMTKVNANGVCGMYFRETINFLLYLSVYLIIRIILIQFVPCILLIILNAKMLNGLRNVTNKKIELQCKSENNHATGKENIRVTIMIICMAVITLLVELPVGVIQCLYVTIYLSNYEIISSANLQYSEMIVNLMIIFSYPLNFLLYCSMSGEFKQTLKELCFSICHRKMTPNGERRKVITDFSNGKNPHNGNVKEETSLLTATKV